MAQSEELVAEDHVEEEQLRKPQLYIVSTARRQATRALRRRPLGGKRHRFNLRICGGKVILRRGKALPLPEELFEKHEEELADLMRSGQIDIRVGGPNGRSIGMPPAEPKERKDESKKAPEDHADDQGEAESSPEAPEGEGGEDEGEEVEVELEEGELPEPDKPLERMNKAELIDYCVQVTGMDAADLEGMVKREILEAIQGALGS